MSSRSLYAVALPSVVCR